MLPLVLSKLWGLHAQGRVSGPWVTDHPTVRSYIANSAGRMETEATRSTSYEENDVYLRGGHRTWKVLFL